MRRSLKGRSSSALHLALAGDVLVAAAKFVGAAATGSSALFSEGVHSTVDAVSEILLLYGLRVGKRPSTAEHQLGFGREVFFWNFIVAMTILALGAGVALLDGIHQILHASVIESPVISYAVLLLALLAELPAMISVSKGVRKKRGETGLVHFVRMSRDPTMLTVMFGGASGILGIVIAATGTFLTTLTNNSVWDGVASVLISMILGTTAIFLAATSKKLLIGVPASPLIVNSILKITTDCPDVETANGAITVHLAPDQILVALSVAFRPTLSTADIEVAVAAIDRAVRAAHPSVVVFLLKPQSEAQFQTVRGHRGW